MAVGDRVILLSPGVFLANFMPVGLVGTVKRIDRPRELRWGYLVDFGLWGHSWVSGADIKKVEEAKDDGCRC